MLSMVLLVYLMSLLQQVEIEIIKSIPNFDFNIPVLGNGNISNGNITLSIPFINKGIMFNQSDLETFRQLLTK